MEDLKIRTKTFALRIIRLYSSLPQNNIAQVIGKQVLRSGTSVGAQYREAYWLELLIESGIVPPKLLNPLLEETKELTAILVTCVKNVKQKSKQ